MVMIVSPRQNSRFYPVLLAVIFIHRRLTAHNAPTTLFVADNVIPLVSGGIHFLHVVFGPWMAFPASPFLFW
jgi:hypothetical protein